MVLWRTRPEPHYCKSLLVWPIHSLCVHFHRVIHLFYLFVDNSFSCCEQISQGVSFGTQPLPRLFGDGSLASCVTYKNDISFSIKIPPLHLLLVQTSIIFFHLPQTFSLSVSEQESMWHSTAYIHLSCHPSIIAHNYSQVHISNKNHLRMIVTANCADRKGGGLCIHYDSNF